MAPSKKQVANAYRAANALGIHKEDIKPVLQDLYKAFDKNWEHIEADNYRVLIDSYFDLKENKAVPLYYFLFFLYIWHLCLCWEGTIRLFYVRQQLDLKI